MYRSGQAWRLGLLVALVAGGVPAAAEELADPMQPLHQTLEAGPEAVPETPAATWLLQGIRIDRHHRSAVINGQVATVGDAVDGARIIKIENDSVTLQSGDEPSTLRLFKHEIKQRSHVPR